MAPTQLGALRGGSIGNLSRLVNRKAGIRARTYELSRTHPRALWPHHLWGTQGRNHISWRMTGTVFSGGLVGILVDVLSGVRHA